jgi:hypothetical protein
MWEGSTCNCGAVNEDALTRVFLMHRRHSWGLRPCFIELTRRLIAAGFDPQSSIYLQYDTCPAHFRRPDLEPYTGNFEEFAR